jgi:hypothetical protein
VTITSENPRKALICRNGFDASKAEDPLFMSLYYKDARHLITRRDKGKPPIVAPSPFSLRVMLWDLGKAMDPVDPEIIVHMDVLNAPREMLELLEPDEGYCAVADIEDAARLRITHEIYDALGLERNNDFIFPIEGVFDSDIPGTTGYHNARLQSSLGVSLMDRSAHHFMQIASVARQHPAVEFFRHPIL